MKLIDFKLDCGLECQMIFLLFIDFKVKDFLNDKFVCVDEDLIGNYLRQSGWMFGIVCQVDKISLCFL